MAVRAAIPVLGSVIGHIRGRLLGVAPGTSDRVRIIVPLRVAALAGDWLAVKAGLVPLQREARELFVVEGGLRHVAGRVVWLRLFDSRAIPREIARDLVGILVWRHASPIFHFGLGALLPDVRVAVRAPVGCQAADRRVAVQALLPVRGMGAVTPARLAVGIRGSDRPGGITTPDLVSSATLADH